MPSQEQLNYVWKLLSHALFGGFAFHCSSPASDSEPFRVTYAQDSGTWSCIVLLLQDLASRGVDPTSKRIYISATTPLSGAAEGMCRFFEVDVQRWPPYTLGWSDGMIQFSHQYMESCPFATFQKVDPWSILGRDALDPFLPGGLGPSPQVDLRGIEQTHFHRIYMALAFRRVQHRFAVYGEGLAIAAVLVNAVDGRVRAFAHNTKNSNVTFHAEVNLVQAFHKAHSAERDGAFFVYSSLQPCPMCAAMIAEKLPNAIVFYGQTDPGKHMQRMASQPRTMISFQGLTFDESIDEDVSVTHKVKPLRVFDIHGQRAHDDVVGRLESVHLGLKQAGNHSLTRNLYAPNSQEAVTGAARTLNRKAAQYLHGGKATTVLGQALRTRRREGIQRIMQHLASIL